MNPQKYSKRLLGMDNSIMNVEIPEFVQSPKDVANYYPELGDRDTETLEEQAQREKEETTKEDKN